MPATDATTGGRGAFLAAFLPSALAVLLPSRCAICDSARRDTGGAGICRECWSSMPTLDPAALCASCALPLDPLADQACRSCRQAPPPLDRAVALGPYEGALARAITSFKFRGLDLLCEPLAGRLSRQASACGIDLSGARLVPIPSTSRRNRERGFDPAELLARALARQVDGRVDRLLRRTRECQPQSALPLRARLANVAGAFRVPAILRRRAEGATLVLVDDVVTTGATAFSAASALRAAGARRIVLAAVARTLDSRDRRPQSGGKEPS